MTSDSEEKLMGHALGDWLDIEVSPEQRENSFIGANELLWRTPTLPVVFRVKQVVGPPIVLLYRVAEGRRIPLLSTVGCRERVSMDG